MKINQPGIVAALALFLVYLIGVYFFGNYRYEAGGATNLLVKHFFYLEAGNYKFYNIVLVVLAVCLAMSSNFKKLAGKIALSLAGLQLIAMVIPIPFGFFGQLTLPFVVVVLILLGMATLIYILIERISQNLIVFGVLGAILLCLTLGLLYINYKDLSVRYTIDYKNNAMFDAIEECNAYFSKRRELDCKRGWTELHERWENMESTIQDPQ